MLNFILGIIVGGVLVFVLTRRDSIASLQNDKERGKQKILKFLENKDRITNDDVERLLKVSDATATRYLDELEKEGKIRQVGKTGRHVYYTLNNSR